LEKLQKKDDSCVQENETLGDFLNSHKYSQKFQECYVIPTCASIWPYPSEIILGFSAASILTFYWNNHLLQVFGDSQCLTVKDHSKTFIAKMVADLEAAAGSHILTKSGVTHISTTSEGVYVSLIVTQDREILPFTLSFFGFTCALSSTCDLGQ
jgi:cyclopropane-fatty-acyl-phospholipid synthase